MKEIVSKASVLIEALPYLQKFRGKTFVFKYGGHAMTDPKLRESFLKDIVLLSHVGIHPVIVHGGGPQIEETLKKLGIKSKYHDGTRITDKDTMDVVEMVLIGKVNSELVRQINSLGGEAVGISGRDGRMIVAKKVKPKKSLKTKALIDLGNVGEVVRVDPHLPTKLLHEDRFIPVISPIGVSVEGDALNINADVVAAEVAMALKAEKLFFLTDVPGVKNKSGKFQATLTKTKARQLIKDKTIQGGMVPKMESALKAVKNGVGSVAIVNGKAEHAALLEIFTDKGVGTLIQ